MFLQVVDVTGWVNLLTPIAMAILIVMQFIRDKRAKESASEVATATKEVASELKIAGTRTTQQLQGIAIQGDMTHSLVNSSYGAQLKLTANALTMVAELRREKADVTKTKLDTTAAAAAEALAEESVRLLYEHTKRQAAVDNKISPQEQQNARPHALKPIENPVPVIDEEAGKKLDKIIESQKEVKEDLTKE